MTAQHETNADPVAATRHRELAIEHLLFQTIREVARDKPELLDKLEDSLPRLWDSGQKDSQDHEAVRAIARSFIRSLRP